MTVSEVAAMPIRTLRRLGSCQALFMVAAAVAAIWPTWPPLVQVWRDTADYNHGPLVAVISVAWLVRSAFKISAGSREASWLPAALLAVALCAWLVTFKANVESGKQALAPLILWLAVASGGGWRAAGSVAPPLFFLYFAIPVWELLVPVLQAMTVAASQAALGLAGVPVRIDGILVTIPEGSFIVQEGCSGKKYLIVALAFGVLLAAMNSLPRRRALGYLTACAALALIANWIRVIIIIVAGHVTNMKHHFVTVEHASLGWAIFIVLLIVIWLINGRFRGPMEEASKLASRPRPNADPFQSRTLVTAIALLCVCAIATAASAQLHAPSQSVPAVAPSPPAAWRPLLPTPDWLPQFIGASIQTRSAFESDAGDRVETYWATYTIQRPDAELIHYANRVYAERWSTLGSSRSERSLRDGRSVEVRRLIAQSPSGSRWVIEYFYLVGHSATTREWMAQLLFGVRSWVRPTPASVVAAAVRCPGSCEAAERVLPAYWKRIRFPSGL